MEITPLDVRSQVFGKKLRGCDPDEVRTFLDAVADRMEVLLKEKEEADRELAVLREKVQSFARMEETMRDALLTAQRVSDDARANAQTMADNIIKQAELDAQKKVLDIATHIESLERERETIRAETVAMVVKLKGMIEGHLRFLTSCDEEIRQHTSSEKAHRQ